MVQEILMRLSVTFLATRDVGYQQGVSQMMSFTSLWCYFTATGQCIHCMTTNNERSVTVHTHYQMEWWNETYYKLLCLSKLALPIVDLVVLTTAESCGSTWLGIRELWITYIGYACRDGGEGSRATTSSLLSTILYGHRAHLATGHVYYYIISDHVHGKTRERPDWTHCFLLSFIWHCSLYRT